MHCNYCDPKNFVIYGFCKNCTRRCEPPLLDPKEVGRLCYEIFRRDWNKQRSDLIMDAMRRMPIDGLGRDKGSVSEAL